MFNNKDKQIMFNINNNHIIHNNLLKLFMLMQIKIIKIPIMFPNSIIINNQKLPL